MKPNIFSGSKESGRGMLSTMIVMIIAITPSLNDSSLDFVNSIIPPGPKNFHAIL